MVGGETPASPQAKPRKPTRDEVRKAIEERQKRVPGIWAMTAKVYREEGGVRALYKGCVPTSVGVAPYVAINFAAVSGKRVKCLSCSQLTIQPVQRSTRL